MSAINHIHLSTAQQPSSSSGFTLIELMLVVTMLSTIALFAAPNLSSWVERNRVDVAARDFLSHLSYAQHEAIGRMRSITLCRVDKTGLCSMAAQRCANHHAASEDWGCGYAVRTKSSSEHTSLYAQTQLKIWPLQGDVIIKGSPAPLIFRPPTGQISTGIRRFEFAPRAFTILSSMESLKRCIYIAAGGRARLAKGGCAQI